MSLGNIIENILSQGTSSQSQNRLRTEAENAERSGAEIEQMLGSLMGGSARQGQAVATSRRRPGTSSAKSRPAA